MDFNCWNGRPTALHAWAGSQLTELRAALADLSLRQLHELHGRRTCRPKSFPGALPLYSLDRLASRRASEPAKATSVIGRVAKTIR